MTWEHKPVAEGTKTQLHNMEVNSDQYFIPKQDIGAMMFYLPPESLAQLKNDIERAILEKKPLTIRFVDGMAAFRKVTSTNREPELEFSIFSNNIESFYDSRKIQRTNWNRLNIYFDWKQVPIKLKQLVMNVE